MIITLFLKVISCILLIFLDLSELIKYELGKYEKILVNQDVIKFKCCSKRFINWSINNNLIYFFSKNYKHIFNI